MDQQGDNKRTIISGVIAVAVLVVLVGGVMALKSSGNDNNTNTSAATSDTPAGTATSQTSDTTPSGGSSAADYKNGTYTATGSYNTPESTETIKVTVTLNSGTVSDVSVQQEPNNPQSGEYQAQFRSGYKALVAGKDIDSVSLSRVSGSSLTSIGFNDAIEQIKDQAKT